MPLKFKNITAFVFTIGLFLFASVVYGQSFGGTPNRFKFTQIDNDTVQVVFPEGLDYWGQRIANLSMYQASMDDSSLYSPPIKTTIIIRNLTTISNGFVAYAPYRSEYFTTPPFSQSTGVSPWIDLLHIHEYRHILQESKVMVGRKWAPEHILFGQSGWSAVNYAILPNWYFEGDAVKTETLYTKSGRGRVPVFYMQIPALRANGKRYSFEKMRAGSFKDPVPNHYVLGYHMTSFLQLEKGDPAWNNITSRAIKKYTLISQSTKKLYDLNNVELYAETVNHLDTFFEEEQANNDTIVAKLDPTNFTSYELPKNISANAILYIKSTFKSIPAYYSFDGKKEHKIFEPNLQSNDHWFDIHENNLIWAENTPNLFWQNEDYSSLKILDIQTGKARYLGKKKRKLFYPKWSENGENIGVLELGSSTKQYIVLLDRNATEVKRMPVDEQVFYSSIIKVDSNLFYLVKNENEKTSIVVVDITSGESEDLSPSFSALIRHPIVFEDYIYFSTSVGIREQVVRIDLATQEMEVMTDAPFRAIDPMIKDGQLYYVSYEGIGYTIRKRPNEALERFYPEDAEIAFYNMLDKEYGSILQDVPTKKFETKKFKKSTDIFEIHTWIPQALPPNFGLTLLMQNKIGTFQSELTYVYNSNEGASQFAARVNYAQVYPKLFVGAAHTLNRSSNAVGFPLDQIPSPFYGRTWAETIFETGFIAPFYLTRGKWNRFLSLEASTNYLIAYYNEVNPAFENLSFPFVNSRLSFYNIDNRSRRQIFSRWGQSFVFDYSYSVDPSVKATQFYALSTFYFPGIFKTHSFTISPSYKYEPLDNNYNYLDAFAASYGYLKYAAPNSYRVLFKYTMPLWYPDIGIRGTAFFQRLYASAFYDETLYTYHDTSDRIYERSVGMELNLNMVLLRIFPFEIGVRGMYRFDYNDIPSTDIDGNSPWYAEILFYGFNF
jgi:hypothetical protein